MGRRKRICRGAAAVLAVLLLLSRPALAAGAEKLGVSTRAMSPNATSQSLGARLEETALGDYVADAFRLGTGAAVALVPGGMLAKSLPGGDLTAEDAEAVFEVSQAVCTIERTEEQLFALLEEGVGTLSLSEEEKLDPDSGPDGFLQISGVSVVFDASQRSGRRVRSITMDDGTALSRAGARSFTVAVPASMLDGSLGFSDLEGLDAQSSAGTAAQLLCAHIREQGQVEIPALGRYVRLGSMDQPLYERFHAAFWLPYVIIAIAAVRLSLQRHRPREADGSRSRRYWE